EGLPPFELAERQGEQVEDGAPPRQRLADRPQGEGALRAAQDVPPRDVLPVDEGLDVREEIRRPLRLVEDDTAGELVEETARIRERILADIGLFERRILMIGKRFPDQRGLARLPRTGEGHHRVLPRQSLEGGLEAT